MSWRTSTGREQDKLNKKSVCEDRTWTQSTTGLPAFLGHVTGRWVDVPLGMYDEVTVTQKLWAVLLFPVPPCCPTPRNTSLLEFPLLKHWGWHLDTHSCTVCCSDPTLNLIDGWVFIYGITNKQSDKTYFLHSDCQTHKSRSREMGNPLYRGSLESQGKLMFPSMVNSSSICLHEAPFYVTSGSRGNAWQSHVTSHLCRPPLPKKQGPSISKAMAATSHAARCVYGLAIPQQKDQWTSSRLSGWCHFSQCQAFCKWSTLTWPLRTSEWDAWKQLRMPAQEVWTQASDLLDSNRLRFLNV